VAADFGAGGMDNGQGGSALQGKQFRCISLDALTMD
jgi:hypothetical protein